MNLFLLVTAAVMVGYAIPVLVSLLFSLSVGRLSPETIARGGRIQPRFVVIHGIVWAVAAAAAGYVVAMIAPGFRPFAVAAMAALLIAALWANADEMKKRQSPLRLISMSVGTVAGAAAGYVAYWALNLRVS